ncbi:putative hydrolase YcgS [Cellulomonas aerilata]|uniref:Putative hydrolase YcgS n=1 Tax=Cellulomonas aerilata TaxID=515326 RepID=A0A512DBY6_9CELL|nr:putative hydrolase YcgS [Cellulomonas aerilata]
MLVDVDDPARVVQVRGSAVEYRLSGTESEAGRPGDVRAAGVVVMLHGGHLSAQVPLGEARLRATGHTLLVPSRPGYGRTAIHAGPGPQGFADTVAALCGRLGIERVRAVMGVSAGGPAAVALTERHPDLVGSLLLVSARSVLPFPTGATRVAAQLAFGPHVEARVWATVRMLLRRSPELGLRAMLASLSTLPTRQVLADLSPDERRRLVRLFSVMRSGHGFAIDVRHGLDTDLGRAVGRPTLIVASRHDGQVGWQHAEDWHQRIGGSRLWQSPSLSHLVWYGSGAVATDRQIVDFIAAR